MHMMAPSQLPIDAVFGMAVPTAIPLDPDCLHHVLQGVCTQYLPAWPSTFLPVCLSPFLGWPAGLPIIFTHIRAVSGWGESVQFKGRQGTHSSHILQLKRGYC